MLSFLGKLPASTSVAGAIDGLDIQKTLRVAAVTLLGVFTLAFGQSIVATGDLSALSLTTVLQDAAQAGIAAVGASAIELVRRFLTNNAQ